LRRRGEKKVSYNHRKKRSYLKEKLKRKRNSRETGKNI